MATDDDQAPRRAPGENDDSFTGGLLGILKEVATKYAREDQGPALAPLGGIGRFEGEVFVDLAETRFGRPLRVTRDLLKRGDSWGLQVRDVERLAQVSTIDAEHYLKQMVRAGYLTSPGRRDACYECGDLECYHRDDRRWELTPKGRSLGHASGRRPSTRKRADALVAKVVKAAAAINADPDAHLWWVKEIRTAGDYADPQRDPLLHVDLAVVLCPRLDDPAEQHKAELRLRDAADDRRERDRAWDLRGYGHFQTRMALAGRSKVLRLFQSHGGAQGTVLFSEKRDLTRAAPPTGPYEEPTDPEPLEHCSWCQRAEPSERVAPRGEAASQSRIGLCRLCSQLGRSDNESFGWYQPLRWTLRETRAALAQQPHHSSGCSLCGRPAGEARQWWPEREDSAKSDPLSLRLCSVCPGLLELADRPDRERGWHWRYQDACVSGMHQVMRGAVNLPPLPAEPRSRKRPRLTDLHHELLGQVRRRGALSALDMARDASSLDHQNSQWWTVRIVHLLGNGLVTPLGAKDVVDLHSGTPVRATSEEERELREQMHTVFTPGPIWDGDAVREPEPPPAWQALHDRHQTLAENLDREASTLRDAGATESGAER
ncbi:hypothetical protein [Streptomyces sp. NBC_01264]|uniref:hypothetical protein n=1 Tax=Streptomyces sp. NBC_01264 TaxID=2903804 RepID=UPI002250756D|nr:hypothetical protein [Streptomyces sp. NBC_01264]MCX4783890.1 hypothetical protein [Streptomyces sp. NBC_01264]